MKINFYLDRPDIEETFITVSISVNGWTLKVSTKIYLSPKDVRLKEGSKTKVVAIKGGAKRDVLIGKYDAIDAKIRKYILQNNTELDLTKEQMKLAMKDIISGQEPNRDHLLMATYEEWLYSRKSKFAETTFITKRSTLSHLKSYLFGKEDISMSEFNTNKFFEDFEMYLQQKNKAPNTIHRIFRDLRAFGNWSSEPERKYIDKLIPPLKMTLTEVENFALSYSDIDLIYNCDLSEIDHLIQVRDTFVLQCLTGLRYSDIKLLKKENFKLVRLDNYKYDTKKSYIEADTKKTGVYVKIPIQSRLWNLLERRNYDLEFYTGFLNVYNKSIKKICKMADLEGEGKKVKFENGKRDTTTKSKYDLVSSHCARRSYVTNLLRLGMSADLIAKTTGHKNGLSFQKYVKFEYDDVENAFANIT